MIEDEFGTVITPPIKLKSVEDEFGTVVKPAPIMEDEFGTVVSVPAEDKVGDVNVAKTAEPGMLPTVYVPKAEDKRPTASDIRETGKGTFLKTQEVTDSEILKIAEITGADPDYVRTMVPWMAGKASDETKGEAVASLGTWLTNAVGLGLPVKILKMTQKAENEDALDLLQDLVRQKQSYAFDIGEFVVPGGGIGTVTKGVGKVAKYLPKAAEGVAIPVGTGAVVGSAAGVGGSQRGEELEGATTGAVLGGVVGGALPSIKVLRAFKNNPDDINLYQNLVDVSLKEKQPLIDNGIEAIKSNQTTPEVTKFLDEIKQTNNQIKTIEDAKKFYNEADLAEQFTNMVKRDIKGEIGKDLAPKFIDKDFTKLDNIVGFISRSQPVVQKIDKETKGLTNLSPTLDKITEKRNQLSQDFANWEKKVDTYFKGKDEQLQIDLVKSLRNKAPVGKATQEDMNKFVEDMAEPMRNWFKEATGIEIDKQEFYIPRLRKTSDDYLLALGRQWKTIEKKTGVDIIKMSPSELLNNRTELLQNTEYMDLVKEIALREGADESTLLQNPGYVRSSLLDMLNSVNSKTKTDTTPFFLRARTGEIPEFVLENDPKQLANRWLKGAVDSIIRPELRELDNSAKVLKDLGLENASAFVAKLKNEITMPAESLVSRLSRTKDKKGYDINSLEKLIKNSGTNEKARQNLLQTAEGMLDDLSEMAYGSLGKFSSAAQNVISPMLSVVPELGVEYSSILGSRAINGGFMEAFKMVPMMTKLRSPAIAKKLGKELGEEVELRGQDLLENEGILEHRWIGEARGDFEKGLEKHGIRKAFTKYKNTILPPAMIMFTMAEKAARLAVLGVSKNISNDLFEKGYASKLAKDFVNNISDVSYKRAVLKALEMGDKTEAQSLISRYLNSKHMLHYDRVHMSEYARAVGPMFRMFTTWPSEMVGKAWFQGVKGGGEDRQRLLEQYLWPYALMKAAQTNYVDKEDQPTRAILGRKGLEGMAPLSSVAGVVDMGPAASIPPAYQLLLDVGSLGGRAITTEDAEEAQTKFNNGMDTIANRFLNLAVPLNGQFFTETLPLLLNEYEEPERGERTSKFVNEKFGIINGLAKQLDTALDNVLKSKDNNKPEEK